MTLFQPFSTGIFVHIEYGRGAKELMSSLFADHQNPCIICDRLRDRGSFLECVIPRDSHLDTGDPSLLGDEENRIEIVYSEEKNILCWADYRAAMAEQKPLVPARQAQRTNQERTPFICPLWVPIHRSFNSQQGPPISNLSGAPNARLWAKVFMAPRQTLMVYPCVKSMDMVY